MSRRANCPPGPVITSLGRLRCRTARPDNTFSWRMTALPSWLALASAASQSIEDPSAIDSASFSSAAESDLLTTHLLCQAHQRAAHRHARRVGRGLAERLGDVLIAAVHLDPCDDRLAFFRAQPRERRLVALQRFLADRRLERRRAPIRRVLVEHARCRRPLRAPHFVANTIDDGLPKVGLQRALVARLELIDALDGADDRFLHEIVGVHQVAAPPRQTTARPPAQRRQKAAEQAVQRIGIAALRPLDQIEGSVNVDTLVIHERRWTRIPYRTGTRMISVPRAALKGYLQPCHCDSSPYAGDHAAPLI